MCYYFYCSYLEAIAMEITTVPLSDKFKSQVKTLWKIRWPDKSDDDFERSWANRDKSASLAVLHKRSLVGFVIASKHITTRHNLYIDYIALTDECRGQGIGSEILHSYVLAAYKNKGSVHLWPEKSELLPWYTRQGFSPSYDGYYNFHSYETRQQEKVHQALNL
jgi:ribosomal protein S18 acetylase RimI-like enzyme